MLGISADLNYKDVLYAIFLESIFLGIAVVFMGLGWSEIRKGKPRLQNGIMIAFGWVLIAVSAYVTYVFILG